MAEVEGVGSDEAQVVHLLHLRPQVDGEALLQHGAVLAAGAEHGSAQCILHSNQVLHSVFYIVIRFCTVHFT